MDFKWFGVIGLSLDIAGFGLLAWDLWPEYKLWRLDADNDLIHKQAAATRPRLEGDALHQTLEGTLNKLALTNLRSLRKRLDIREWPASDGDITDDWLSTSQQDVANAIKAKRTRSLRRERPPVGVGISLIFLGFAMQIVGSWPR